MTSPAPATGMRGAGPAKHTDPAREPWFGSFLRRELAPYPGRAALVARIVLAGALTMLIANAAQLSGAALGVFFTILIPRDSLGSTLKSSLATMVSYLAGGVYMLVGAATLIDSPVTHFFFVVGTAYLLFFLVGTGKNYGVAAGFVFMVASSLPLWDVPGDVNLKVGVMLRILLSVGLSIACTLAVECVYHAFSKHDLILAGVADRLRTVARALAAFSENRPPDPGTRARLLQYAMVGSSTLRQQLIRSGQTPAVRARTTAVISMTSRLVELCAATAQGRGTNLLPPDRERLGLLAKTVRRQAATIRALRNVRQMGAAALPAFSGSSDEHSGLATLPEMERSARLLSDIPNSYVSGRQHRNGNPKRPAKAPPGGRLWGLLIPTAFDKVNFIFALRGCAASSFCYVVYNSLDWQGLNTSFVTCIITALGSVGASRQKQVLRIAGAVIGGVFISLPAQAFLLPRMDSISAFTLFFVIVTAFAAWVATASQRLGYCGVQIALAFDLINTQEPFRQISLSAARDRVLGILLGLVAMWLLFDRFSPVRASDQMKSLLRRNLILLGDLADSIAALASENAGGAVAHCEALREQVNTGLSTMNGEADAVQFEYGPDRARQLRERERMLAMQPPMRSLFLLATTIWESGALPDFRKGSSTAEFFLERIADAFRALAALVSRPVKKSQPAESAELQAAVAAVEQALESMKSEPALFRELCRTMVFSLRALERAATGRPPF